MAFVSGQNPSSWKQRHFMRAHLRKFASLRADLRQLVGTCDSMPQQEAGYVQQGTTVSFS